MGKCLEGLQEFSLALELYEKISSLSNMNSCFESMIKHEKEPKKAYNDMKNHAAFCEKYGRIPDAIKIYQKMSEKYFYST